MTRLTKLQRHSRAGANLDSRY